MLRKPSKEEIEVYMDFLYGLATDITKSSYPTFCDGIKTKEDFLRFAYESFDNPNDTILLFEKDGEVLGSVHYYYIKEDNYLSTFSFQSKSDMDIFFEELLKHLSEKYKGTDFYIGFSNLNTVLTKVLKKKKFKLIDNTFHTIFDMKEIKTTNPSPLVSRISRENFQKFEQLHQNIIGEMYWNSERILDDFDNWAIFIYEKENVVLGAIYYMIFDDMVEIFGIDYLNSQFDNEVFKELVIKVIYEVEIEKKQYINYFVEKEEYAEAMNLGFKGLGKYLCFLKKIK